MRLSNDGDILPRSRVSEMRQVSHHDAYFNDEEALSLLAGTKPYRASKKGLSSPFRWLLIGLGLVSLVVLAGGSGFLAAVNSTKSPVLQNLREFATEHILNGNLATRAGELFGRAPPSRLKKITMDHIFNGTFSARSTSLHWIPEAGDGVFSVSSGSAINLVSLKTNETRTLVNLEDIKDAQGNALDIADWSVSPDMSHVLVKADYRKQWRYSSFGNFYVHNIETKQTWPIVPPSNPSKTAYATWSPTGQTIAYVIDNDLYIIPSASPDTPAIRVTTNGNANVFNGVPDWVYEEEIFGSDFTLWFSPDSKKVAFLSFDETEVPEFTFPIYNPTEDAKTVNAYHSDVVMKYPKAGFPNPIVTLQVFDLDKYLETKPESPASEISVLEWEGRHPDDIFVMMEIAWLSNTSLLIKEVNRNADDGNVVLFDLSSEDGANGKVVRKLGKNGEHGDDGWIDADQLIYPLFVDDNAAYLDIVPNKDGFNHIALFSPASSSTPQFLTTGDWEVTGAVKAVDTKRGLVYFTAARPSIERHLYSVPLPLDGSTITPTSSPKELTDTSKRGYYSTSFSPEANFYVLSYAGPEIPWQRVIEVDNASFDYVLNNNDRLKPILAEYEAPTVSWSTITVDGYELNVKETRPPNMDTSGRTKYPVLFFVYGGPFSQQVDTRYPRTAWANYLAATLQYVVVSVDGRGTGYKGRKLRNPVNKNLGFFETIDQVEAGRIYSRRPYVDPKRIGIWGWSYGGFMAGKVVEADAGIHSLAMSVAPVTSWQLYDTIYTERYMNTPQLNPGGYINASISDVSAFDKVDYFIAHGSGDDNVHYSNTAHLIDMFTQAKIRKYRFRVFTDSDHSIAKRGANREVYESMTAFLEEKWGQGAKRRSLKEDEE